MAANDSSIRITIECAPNIALIKYWGKQDDELILPLNGSISVSLDHRVLASKTSLMLVKKQSNDVKGCKIKFWLNNLSQEFFDDGSSIANSNTSRDLISKKRFLSMLRKVRSNCLISNPHSFDIHICSVNNFPTACGLASSASGFACLALCLANVYEYKGDVSELARLGSGSACRSCSQGFVKWTASKQSETSIATTIFPANHWPELNIIVLVLTDERKDVSSTYGMSTSTQTSEFLQHRVKLVEEKRLKEMEQFILARDFQKFAKLTIQDSNNFHSVCMDTYPPLFYLNEKSREVISFVEHFNGDNLKVAYSFDAGPNAFLFVEDTYLSDLITSIYENFFADTIETKSEFINSKLIRSKEVSLEKFNGNSSLLSLKTNENLRKSITRENNKSIIKYLIHSKVGNDPQNYGNDLEASLLNPDATPKHLKSNVTCGTQVPYFDQFDEFIILSK